MSNCIQLSDSKACTERNPSQSFSTAWKTPSPVSISLRKVYDWFFGRCHETPHRVHRAHRSGSRRARRVTGRIAPSSVLPLHLFNVTCLFCCLFSNNPSTIVFQGGVRGARGAVFRDTPVLKSRCGGLTKRRRVKETGSSASYRRRLPSSQIWIWKVVASLHKDVAGHKRKLSNTSNQV